MATIKNIGSMDLERGWPYGSHTWKPGMDRNLMKLAYMTHGSAKSRATIIPDSGAVGDVYIDPDTDRIVFWDKDPEDETEKWLSVAPPEGCIFWLEDTGTMDAYVGSPLEWTPIFDPNTVVPPPAPRSVAFYVPGEVLPNSTAYLLPVRVSVDFAADFAGSFGYADVEPTANVVFSVQKNGVEFGTITFATGMHEPTFAGTAASFVEGDLLRIVAPAAGNGMKDTAVTLKGAVPGL